MLNGLVYSCVSSFECFKKDIKISYYEKEKRMTEIKKGLKDLGFIEEPDSIWDCIEKNNESLYEPNYINKNAKCSYHIFSNEIYNLGEQTVVQFDRDVEKEAINKNKKLFDILKINSIRFISSNTFQGVPIIIILSRIDIAISDEGFGTMSFRFFTPDIPAYIRGEYDYRLSKKIFYPMKSNMNHYLFFDIAKRVNIKKLFLDLYYNDEPVNNIWLLLLNSFFTLEEQNNLLKIISQEDYDILSNGTKFKYWAISKYKNLQSEIRGLSTKEKGTKEYADLTDQLTENFNNIVTSFPCLKNQESNCENSESMDITINGMVDTLFCEFGFFGIDKLIDSSVERDAENEATCYDLFICDNGAFNKSIAHQLDKEDLENNSPIGTLYIEELAMYRGWSITLKKINESLIYFGSTRSFIFLYSNTNREYCYPEYLFMQQLMDRIFIVYHSGFSIEMENNKESLTEEVKNFIVQQQNLTVDEAFLQDLIYDIYKRRQYFKKTCLSEINDGLDKFFNSEKDCKEILEHYSRFSITFERLFDETNHGKQKSISNTLTFVAFLGITSFIKDALDIFFSAMGLNGIQPDSITWRIYTFILVILLAIVLIKICGGPRVIYKTVKRYIRKKLKNTQSNS